MTQQFMIQGRIVFGHPLKGRIKKDIRTKQPIIKDGQQVMQYVFGVAIDKATFGQQVWPLLYKEAQSAFPNGIPSNFTYKFKDGDTTDSKGQPFNTREGYAGHCVLTISTEGFAPQVFKHENGAYRQLMENEIKCGDYVGVNITTKYNGAVSPNTPGLYINPNGVIHLAYMPEIVTAGQDPDEMFANFQPVLPPGASAVPIMGTAPMPGAMQPQPQPYGHAPQPAYGAPPAAAPAAYPPQPASPATLPPPAHDFVNNARGYAPPAAPAYGAPPNPQPYAANAGYPQPVSAGPTHMAPSATPAYPSNQPVQYGQQPAQPGYGAPAAPGYPGMPVGR